MTADWLNNFLLYLYVLSLLFASAYFFAPQPRLRRVTYSLTTLLWALQSIVLILWLFDLYSFVVCEPFLLYVWGLLTLSLLVLYIAKLDVLLVFANFFGCLVWLKSLLFPQKKLIVINQLMLSKWVSIHVAMAMVSYAALSLSSLCAGLYLLANYQLKQKKWHQLLRLLPSLGKLQHISKHLMQMGLILLVFSLFQGIWIAYYRMANSVFVDPKTIGSLIVLVIYSSIFYRLKIKSWQGQKLAWWIFLSILVMIANYYLLNTDFSFHYWI